MVRLKRLRHANGAVADVAIVLRGGGGAETPAKLGELLVNLRPMSWCAATPPQAFTARN